MPYCVARVVHRESLGCLWKKLEQGINETFACDLRLRLNVEMRSA